MEYQEFITWLEAVPLYGHKDGLANIKKILEAFRHPEEGPKIIHVAGTNGKGSCCAMLSGILSEAGYKTGLFTSPHLIDYTERIMIDKEQISKEDFAFLGDVVRRMILEMVARGENHATFFEILTAMAFLYFAGVRSPKETEKIDPEEAASSIEEAVRRLGLTCSMEEPCDIIVLETGVGGRLDSTNAVDNKILTLITSISLDHTKVLGSTVEEIAGEKAGILREDCPVVLAKNRGRVRETVLKKAGKIGAPFYYAGDEEPQYEIPLVGDYQRENLGAVQVCVRILKEQGLRIPETAVAEGLRRVQWPGRMEHVTVLGKSVILDGCHNPGGAGEMAKYLEKYCEKGSVTILFSALAKKDVTAILEPIRDQEAVQDFIFTCIDGQDETKRFEEIVGGVKPWETIKDPKEALIAGAKRETSTLIVCGSLYLIGEIKRILRDEMA